MSKVVEFTVSLCAIWIVILLGGIYEELKRLNENFERRQK
jgi:hypothetical protein